MNSPSGNLFPCFTWANLSGAMFVKEVFRILSGFPTGIAYAPDVAVWTDTGDYGKLFKKRFVLNLMTAFWISLPQECS
jgi:hypothetical protein